MSISAFGLCEASARPLPAACAQRIAAWSAGTTALLECPLKTSALLR